MHYMLPLGVLLCVLAVGIFLAEKYLEKISNVWTLVLGNSEYIVSLELSKQVCT